MKRIFTLISCAVLSTAAMFAQTPFKTTTIENGDFAEGTTWYTMGIGVGAKLIKDNAGADHIALGVSTPKGNDDELWCFVGNATDGYAVYNKQAGTSKVLASKTSMSAISGYGGTGGSTHPTMQDAANLPNGYVGRWDFAASNKIANVNGYFMRIHGTNYAVNDFGGLGKLAFWAEGADAGSTITFTVAETSVEILASKGDFTASNANGDWHSKWESSELAGFSLSTNANNMTTSGDYIAGYSGQSGTSSYTLTAPEGLVIKGYSFNYVNTNNDGSYTLTLTAEGKSYTTSATQQSLEVEVAEPARTVYFTQSGANKGITFSNFVVYLGLDIRTPEPAFDVFPTLTTGAIPYRIPAIATAKNGNIIAVADYRHSRADIGMATNGRIDLRARISTDNGETWGEIFDIIQGKGAAGIDASNNDMYVGFGDPAIVADRESDRVLVISCSGNVSFPNGQRNNHQGIAHFYSEDCGLTWSTPVDRAEHIYAQFDNTQHGPVRAMFVGSGKISQSQYIKVGEYYRIYCAVLVKNVNGTHVNFVLYSDNFGESWTVLGGGEVSPIPSGGDEPKADELPDGSVIISSRTTGGRIYNIFSYTDSEKAEGSWGTAKYSNSSNNGTIAVSNSTNGEIMFVPAKRTADDKKVYLALQSVPLGSGRANVGIYYKELESLEDFISPDAIAADWDGRHQSSYVAGAYSTMTLQHDNNIGFLYEEDTYGTSGGGYTIVYKNYSIEYITDSAYVFDADVDKTAIVAAGIDAKIAEFDTEGPTYVGSVDSESLNTVASLIEAYKTEPSYEAYEAINAGIANMPRLEVKAGKWYRIRNSERSNATLYLNPEASRVSTATSNIRNANQLFTFVPTGNDKEFYLYNGNYQYMLGPLGNNETQPIVTTDNAAAGKWKIESTATGLSSIICQNKTGSNTGLHLAGDNVRLVPWTNNAEASLWYIEPVDEFALTINEFTVACMPFVMTLPEGVIAYTAGAPQTADGVEFIPLTECGTGVIAANTPVVLAAENGTYSIGVGGEAEELEADNQLRGVLKSTSISGSNIYTFKNGAFAKRTATSGTMSANIAYYTADSDATTLNLVKGEATGIEEVKGENNKLKFYDLKGNLIERPLHGIYVTSEGKKILVK
ncbi:MAG: exo-alpha-sialidase [Bacteroidaceae bacterium]|nr:exo-alpha-sialidase [Bacteroidaceae bacterium]